MADNEHLSKEVASAKPEAQKLGLTVQESGDALSNLGEIFCEMDKIWIQNFYNKYFPEDETDD